MQSNFLEQQTIPAFQLFRFMKRIGLLSDTHGFLDDAVFRHFDKCDEIWHAGDFGSREVVEALQSFKPLRGVFGNIDGQDVRTIFPEVAKWKCEEANILMMHIGGYPPKYTAASKKIIAETRPQLFISGHSHILKVMYDKAFNCLHINPGAAGKQGWQQVRTLISFVVEGKEFKDLQLIELGKK